MQESKFVIPFYTQERWQNWISKVKESGFKLDEQEKNPEKGAVFVNMEDDIVLACLKVIASCECYVEKGYHKTKDFDKLIKGAVKAEKEDNMGAALGNIAEIGANILAGGKLKDKDLEDLPEGLVAEWLDGIDSIKAAMVGDTSYKDDEPDDADP